MRAFLEYIFKFLLLGILRLLGEQEVEETRMITGPDYIDNLLINHERYKIKRRGTRTRQHQVPRDVLRKKFSCADTDLNGKMDKIYEFVNTIDPDAPEKTVQISFLGYSRPQTFNLAQILFESAVYRLETVRIETLLRIRRDLHLSSEQKAIIFIKAIEHLNFSPVPHKVYEIIWILLGKKFYEPETFLNTGNPEIDCPLKPVFRNDKVLNLFLKHDPEFFRKNEHCNYISDLASNSEFAAASKALDFGVNPFIVMNGRNALDSVIAATVNPNPDEDGLALLTKLRGIEDLTESFNFENFATCCYEGRFDYATKMIQTGFIEPASQYHPDDSKISPLSVAIKTNNEELINAVLKFYLSTLTHEQLSFAVYCCGNLPKSKKFELSLLIEEQLLLKSESK